MCKVMHAILVGVVLSTGTFASAEADPSARDKLIAICKDEQAKMDPQTKTGCKIILSTERNARAIKTQLRPDISGTQALDTKSKERASATVDQATSPTGGPKRLFVRADAIDNFWYSVAPGGLNAVQGASVGYTDDRVAGTQSAPVKGRVSYLLVAPGPKDIDTGSEYALAAWISADGTWKQPFKVREVWMTKTIVP